MQLVLERRAERSAKIALLSPLIAVGLTLVTMTIVVKASPLVLIGVGLSLCYLANVWNIGAEGQFLIGAVRKLVCGHNARH